MLCGIVDRFGEMIKQKINILQKYLFSRRQQGDASFSPAIISILEGDYGRVRFV
jgi:hypothetical protein